MKNSLAKKYRIKSWQPITKILFVVEEIGKPGELRLMGTDLIANKEMLAEFDPIDVARIVSAVNF